MIKVNYQRSNELRKIRGNLVKAEGIIEYGGCCVCCNEDREEFLTIDHINGRTCEDFSPGGKKLVGKPLWIRLKKMGWPKENIQLLCWNCNYAKGIYGLCPHQERLKNDI
jgi:5-methylcytosine-specific restriction endonuclease McrA